jgi:adhesin/invasin
MHTQTSARRAPRWTTLFAGTLALAALVGACHSNDDNTAPLIATNITADVLTNQQTGVVGAALAAAVIVHVTDQNNNPIANATVTWTVQNGNGTVSSPTSVTDATGTATVIWTLDTQAGSKSLVASLAGGASVTINATGTAGPATQATAMSGDNQSVTAGTTTAAIIMLVTDQYNNPVAGVAVAWTSTGGGTLSGVTSTTDVNGQAQVTYTTSTTAGPYTVTGTATGLTPVVFNGSGT